ncbi:kinase-like domain-containing protein [Mycena albidolilacea]|uniref:Kinase-like domain-containing protein n=1 Tax=Mycena albidolilacea TaxID=1033008 RepID=A0AAD7EZ43_9AGAR|nr:kinase-like domain-containing protein [Mycena albidolilacea]
MESSPIRNGALHSAANQLLGIWDGIQEIEVNRQACLRLAERSANILLAVLQEVQEAGEDIVDFLSEPLERFVEALKQIEEFLSTMARRSFLKRYLTRSETLREIERCDHLLKDALQMFSLSLQIRVLKQMQIIDVERRRDAEELLQKLPLLGVDDPGELSSKPTHTSPPSVEEKTEDVFLLLETLQNAPSELDSADHTAILRAIVQNAMTKNSDVENKLDSANDTTDLRAILMRALTQNNDAEMLRILQVLALNASNSIAAEGVDALQVDREDMAEAIKLLQRAMDDSNVEVLPAYTPGAALPDYEAASVDKKLIVGVIDILRRVSEGKASSSNLKTTLSDFELQEKIGSSFFADVFRAQFHGEVAVVKRLPEVTPSPLFFKTRDIWRNLSHPHVLELLDATEDGDEILFFVCPYQPHGSLAELLRRVADEKLARNEREGELVRYMHEVADGMRYLHDNGVAHGNLKAANVLVDNGIHCVVTDFGLSEMKAEVCRISNAAPPRGALRWHAPELLLGSSLPTREADVYAYAMCCVEILSWGFPPWRHVGDDSVREFVLSAFLPSKRPDIPLTGVDSPALQKLLRNCWADDPAARPSFSAIFVDIAHLCKPLAYIRSTSGPSLPVVPGECTATDAGTAGTSGLGQTPGQTHPIDA